MAFALRPYRLLLAATLAVSPLLVNCSDDESDPTAVALDELKFAFGLRIQDQGNGNIRLWWSGANNEADFSGYNIYGVKDNATVAAKAGSVIQLLDDAGEPIAAGKDLLSKMAYNGKDWETPGTEKREDDQVGYYPFYKDKTILPSCIPQGDKKECKVGTKATSAVTLNGMAYTDLTGLKPGGQYCFVVVSTLDEATKISSSTSEVACVVPRSIVKDLAVTVTDGFKNPTTLDLTALRTACAKGVADCKITPASATGITDCKTTPGLCIEYGTSTLHFNGNEKTAVQDLGYYTGGISPEAIEDDNFPMYYKLTKFGDVQNLDGYSIPGQSLPLQNKHVYAIATAANDAKTSFYYDLIYVTKLTETASGAANTLTLEIRVANKAE